MKAQQTELCFSLPVAEGARVSAKDWRSKLWAASEGSLPSWLFGRDEAGARFADFPQIRFLGGRNALRIVAFGEEMSEELSALMPKLFRAMNRAAGTTVPVRVNDYEVSAHRLPYDRLYHVAVPILTRRGDRRYRYADDAPPAARSAKVMSRLMHGLARQAQFFGLDFPMDGEADVVECGAFRGRRIHEGFGYGVQYAVIGLPVDLKGVWQTGLLLSHGHGVVTRYRRAVAESVSGIEERKAA